MTNVENLDFELIDLFGQTALFADCRIDRTTVPEGLFCYDLRHEDDDDSLPATMEKNVTVNWFGTVICGCNFHLESQDSYVAFGEEDFGFTGEEMDISQYLEEFELSGDPLPTVL